ncbi:MAG: protein translocase subunit SecF [Spirochaetaceae bacterium]|jgi:preprotein translocase subunit SecF|nr:protein translocase subunit SecF [Spirochaetaceae bacterium]
MRVIKFSRGFKPAAIISSLVILAGLVSYFIEGFNMGVDFRAGLVQEVQLAPPAFSMTYSGRGNASVSFSQDAMQVVISGAGVEGVTHTFAWTAYPTMADLQKGLTAIDGIGVNMTAPSGALSNLLLQSASGNPQLGTTPYFVHYLPEGSELVPLEQVREAVSGLGQVSVQVMGNPADRHFMIRIDEEETSQSASGDAVISALETVFGDGNVAVIRSDYVGSRFSQALGAQAVLLIAGALILILIYSAIRFKPQFAIGAVLAIAHDALIMVTFFVWSRMEFNTTSIAAILTILGYSINDTIVIFDRIRENKRIFPDEPFRDLLNQSISETLGRTIITTATTMLAVVMLLIFTTGSMRDFAAALLVGMVSGTYSTIFIASGFTNFWDSMAQRKAKKVKAV